MGETCTIIKEKFFNPVFAVIVLLFLAVIGAMTEAFAANDATGKTNKRIVFASIAGISLLWFIISAAVMYQMRGQITGAGIFTICGTFALTVVAGIEAISPEFLYRPSGYDGWR